MSNHIGTTGIVTIGGNTVAELKSYSVNESADAIDSTNNADTAKRVKAGRPSWSGSIACQWDETDTTGQEAMTIGASVAVVFKPEGAGVGNVTLTGTGVITARGMEVAEESIITTSFELAGDGALVRGTE